ncbi:type III-B CRISPR module-associated Cmr3 family protein [Paenibacillus sp. SYP-B4298]|uniref:type III-B CRISPR module-associated Cmr3 family protein n=1 Tax=Paenibacillus sp. SYP-B4298 TaxID=2996034 RepID=UPI0022DDF4BB|nr:type III-B CRISPR module-associated Cmr3 family protein [Paenibacillus sp. SYP-B4298]
MQMLTLTPADSFFFKGHMMTEMGTPSHWSSLFPPRPNTVYGALRSAYIHKHGSFKSFREGTDNKIKHWMGTPTSFGAFRQQALLLKHGDSPLLPVPMDTQIRRKIGEGRTDNSKLQAVPLKLIVNGAVSSTSVRYTLMPFSSSNNDEKVEDHHGKYASREKWCEHVWSQEPLTDLHTLTDILDTYQKMGIRLDEGTRAAEDSHFFQFNMMSMKKGYALLSMGSEEPDFSEVPYVSMGAENRPWFIQRNRMPWQLWTELQLQQLKEQLLANSIARIILLTPLVLPVGFSFEQQLQTRWEMLNGAVVQLITWATGHSELYGGWDIVRHRPKPRAWMLPAGTVFYVKVRKEDIPKFIEAANGFTLFSGETDGRDFEGFGFAVIAGTKQNITVN